MIEFLKANIDTLSPIPEWDNFYITPCGKVLKITEVTTHNNGNGYLEVKVMISGLIVRDYIHRLVAKIFLDNPEQHETVDHIDGDKSHNNAINLRWMTLKDNVRKYFKKDAWIMSPTGEVFHFENVRKFAVENGLDSSSLTKVMKGKAKQHKGWRAVPSDVQY